MSQGSLHSASVKIMRQITDGLFVFCFYFVECKSPRQETASPLSPFASLASHRSSIRSVKVINREIPTKNMQNGKYEWEYEKSGIMSPSYFSHHYWRPSGFKSLFSVIIWRNIQIFYNRFWNWWHVKAMRSLIRSIFMASLILILDYLVLWLSILSLFTVNSH